MNAQPQKLKCICGDHPAEYLINGYNYDPDGIGKRGRPYVNQPSCETFMKYCREASNELGFDFSYIKLADISRYTLSIWATWQT